MTKKLNNSGRDDSLWNAALGPVVPQLAGVKGGIDPRKLLVDAAVRHKLGISKNIASPIVRATSRRRWLPEEDALVRDRTRPVRELSTLLNRSPEAVSTRRNFLRAREQLSG